MKLKALLLATMIMLALVSAVPSALATRTPFKGQLTFNYGVCANPTTSLPQNPCQWWKYAWVGWVGSVEFVHLRGITGTWTLNGTISGKGNITWKDADVSWDTWSKTMTMPAVPTPFQDYAFQARGTIDGYTMLISATVHAGQVANSMFEMRGHGTFTQGTVTAVDWNTSTGTLEGWTTPAS